MPKKEKEHNSFENAETEINIAARDELRNCFMRKHVEENELSNSVAVKEIKRKREHEESESSKVVGNQNTDMPPLKRNKTIRRGSHNLYTYFGAHKKRHIHQSALNLHNYKISKTLKTMTSPTNLKLIRNTLLLGLEGDQKVLVDVAAWLVINSMRSERIQFNQLCIQNVSNVWRKNSFKTLLAHYKE